MEAITDNQQGPVQANDPTGSRFYSYPSPEPHVPWEYIVDDYGVGYREGEWPFGRMTESRWTRQPCSIRLAPDHEYRAAGQTYVRVSPTRSGRHAIAYMNLTVRSQGMGAIVVACRAEIDLSDFTVTLDGVQDGWPDTVKAQADQKTQKVVSLIRAQVARRDAGKRKVSTAHEKHRRRT